MKPSIVLQEVEAFVLSVRLRYVLSWCQTRQQYADGFEIERKLNFNTLLQFPVYDNSIVLFCICAVAQNSFCTWGWAPPDLGMKAWFARNQLGSGNSLCSIGYKTLLQACDMCLRALHNKLQQCPPLWTGKDSPVYRICSFSIPAIKMSTCGQSSINLSNWSSTSFLYQHPCTRVWTLLFRQRRMWSLCACEFRSIEVGVPKGWCNPFSMLWPATLLTGLPPVSGEPVEYLQARAITFCARTCNACRCLPSLFLLGDVLVEFLLLV